MIPMKINQVKAELKQLNKAQLLEKLDYTRQELFKMRLQSATALVKDNSQFKKLKSQVARILMYIHQLD